jgi:hypothetical protein
MKCNKYFMPCNVFSFHAMPCHALPLQDITCLEFPFLMYVFIIYKKFIWITLLLILVWGLCGCNLDEILIWVATIEIPETEEITSYQWYI